VPLSEQEEANHAPLPECGSAVVPRSQRPHLDLRHLRSMGGQV